MNTYDIAGMVEHYYKTAGITPEPEVAAKLVDEEYEEWLAEVNPYTGPKTYKPEAELEELADLVFVIYGYAQSRKWNLNEAVYRKFLTNIARMFQDDGTLKRNEQGKILKNPSTPKCDLSDLV